MNTHWNPTPQAWRDDYEATGYLVVPDALDADLLALLRGEMDALEAQVRAGDLPPGLRPHVHLDSDRMAMLGRSNDGAAGDTISVVMELPLFGPHFAQLIAYPRVLDVLEALFDTSEFAFHNYKAVCKMPGGNAPFQWHRDLPYLQHTSPELITCMLCLDDMTVENGATVVCPGTHQIRHEDVSGSDVDIPESAVPHPRETVACPAGSAVFFHVNLIHGGGPNRSDGKRRNLISIWAGPDSLPITPGRYAYEFLMPRSREPMRQRQTQMSLRGGEAG